MHTLWGVVVGCAGLLLAPFGGAQPYPDRPIRAIVSVPAGGTADVLARIVTPAMSTLLGQQVVVDNRGGAAGLVAAELAAKATPDGYTLLLTSSGALTIVPHLSKSVPYDTLHDFAPIALVSTGPFLLVTNPSLPVTTVQDLIALAKAQPGKLNYGSGGNGTANHLGMELFKSMAGIDITHIPYKGAPQTVTDLLGGRIALTLNSIPPSIPLIRDGRMRALAIAGAKRSPLLPGVPTASESGLPGYEAGNWLGLLAPARTPARIIVKLNEVTVKAVATPYVHSRLEELGTTPVANSPEEFRAFIRSEWELNAKIVKLAGAKVD